MAKATKKTGTALVKWEDKFAAAAKKTTAGVELPAGKFISVQSGQLTFNGDKIPDNVLRCVVVGWCYENAYYDPDVPYKAGEPSAPMCYAFGTDKEDMAPHPEAAFPQNDNCASCQWNQFESAERGRGKACGNKVRLALIPESEIEDDNLANPEIAYFRVAVTSVKNWMKYIKELDKSVSRPHWAVITELAVEPDGDTQFKITFNLAKPDGLIEDSNLFEPLEALWESSMEGIDFPYPKYEKVEQPKRKAASAGKFAAKGKR